MNTSESNTFYDLVVIGGGPAGAALATFVQRAGHECLILERTAFPRYHIGESLIPHTYGVLDRLGLLPMLRGSDFPPKYSVRFVPPSGRETEPFYFSETIQGDGARTWQVERSEFDQMCLDNARESGVDVRMATRVEQVLFEDSRAMGVRVLRDNGDPREIPARVVADCSGRATRIGSQLGLRGPVPGLKKSSLWGYYRGGKRLDGIDAGETTIFMLPQGGWFWYIPLPEDTVSVGIVADPEYVFGDDKDLNAAFVSRVAQCPPLSARLSEAHLIGPVRGLRNLAYRNRKIVGDGWLMVGDAAAFLDPIYSSGLFLALASAELAANCVHEALASGNLSQAKLGEFAAPLSEGIEVIRRLIHAFYDPNFNFQKFVARYPGQRTALIDCLVGDVINKDMDSFLDALASMTDPPEPLNTIN